MSEVKVEKSDREWREQLTPAQYDVLAQGGHRGAVHGRVRRSQGRRLLPLRGLWRDAVRLGHEIRFRHGLAELHRAGGRRSGRAAPGQRPVHAPHRGDLPHLRWTPGARLRRWPRPDRTALLHQLGGARLPARVGADRLPIWLPRPGRMRAPRLRQIRRWTPSCQIRLNPRRGSLATMIMQDQSKRLSEPLRWGAAREDGGRRPAQLRRAGR